MRLIAGVDEAGRGPLAGPVAVAAVVLDPTRPVVGVADSKILSEARREALYETILANSLAVSIVLASPQTIDRINIRAATLDGMRRAVLGLAIRPDFVEVDGKDLPAGLPCPGRAVIDGDALVPAISAASILAKVTRDRLMNRLSVECPGYGFETHKGYGTAAHLAALEHLGATLHHRFSFGRLKGLSPGAKPQR